MISLYFLAFLPSKNGIKISPRIHGRIRQHFIISFNIRKRNFLIEQKFIQLRIMIAMTIYCQIIEVLLDLQDNFRHRLLPLKEII